MICALPRFVPLPKAPADEFRLIAAYLRDLDRGDGVALGNGDDAAILELRAGEQAVVSSDVANEGVHFPPDSPAPSLAFRAVAAAASDLAAMGARPVAMTLNLSLPTRDEAFFAGLRDGLQDACRAFSLPLVGGDLVRGPLSLGVQVFGAVPRGHALLRSGARVGDQLCVSGFLGDAAAGLALEQGRLEASGEDAEALRAAFWRPQPALGLGQALRDVATAAIDVSDGLLADVGHLARASGVGAVIDSPMLPLSAALKRCVDDATALRMALTGGDDYVLCFTLPGDGSVPPACTVIGRIEAGTGVSCDTDVDTDGYRHF